jgi:hypothetical protein
MNCYRVWFDNGAAVLQNAITPEDAKKQAEDEAAEAGYGGLRAVRVERLTSWWETKDETNTAGHSCD